MKKTFCTIIGIILIMCTVLPISANAQPALEEQFISLYIEQCESYGIPLTESEKETLRVSAIEEVYAYANENGYSINVAYQNIINELQTEKVANEIYNQQTNNMSRSSKGDGNTTLPLSYPGDIFFVDNDMPYNHVGMYTTSNTIIESMPDYGVHEGSIYGSNFLQDTTGDSHDQSCVMYVNGASDTDISQAISWARGYIGKAYDREFLSNKKDTEKENTKFNCSELVWKSYKYGSASKFDLDSNGGLAVYPNNILNSDLTIYRYDA